jgi:hypothetical protein
MDTEGSLDQLGPVSVRAPRTEIEYVIPYYAGQAHFALALDSVIAQPGDWLATVIDDASPDGHARYVVEQRAHPRVRYLRHPTNLELSRGTWTTILGQDDVLWPSYATVIARSAAAHPNASMIQPGVRVIRADGRAHRPPADLVKTVLRPRGNRLLGGQPLASSLLTGDWLYFPSIAWRTDIAAPIGFDASLRTAMDLDHVLTQILDGRLLAVDDEVCFDYRRHAASASSSLAATGSRFTEERELFALWADRLQRHGWPRAATAARRHLTARLHMLAVAAAIAPRQPGASGRLAAQAVWAGRTGQCGTASRST